MTINFATINKSLSNSNWAYFQCPNAEKEHSNRNDKFHVSPSGYGKCWACQDFSYQTTTEELEQLKVVFENTREAVQELQMQDTLIDFNYSHTDWRNCYDKMTDLHYKHKKAQDGYNTFCDYIESRGISILNNNWFVPNLRFQFSFFQNRIEYIDSDEENKELMMVVNPDSFVYKFKLDKIKETKEEGKPVKMAVSGSTIEPLYFHDVSYKGGDEIEYCVFEGLEDALAFIELYDGKIDYVKTCFIVTFGCTHFNKIKLLPNNSYLFCLDKDKASLDAYNKVKQKHQPQFNSNNNYIDYDIDYIQPVTAKDWNDELNILKKYENKERFVENKIGSHLPYFQKVENGLNKSRVNFFSIYKLINVYLSGKIKEKDRWKLARWILENRFSSQTMNEITYILWCYDEMKAEEQRNRWFKMSDEEKDKIYEKNEYKETEEEQIDWNF
jgi:hypothetical protein